MRKLPSILLYFALAGAACAGTPAPTAKPELQHESVEANGVRLHYVVAGEGAPVLLLPGWPENWYAWREVVPLLVRAGRKVYVLDPRGFGDSDKPLTGYTPEIVAADIHEFLSAAGLLSSRGVDVVGHDLGTWIAFFHAARYPQDVRHLVLSEASIPGVSVAASGPTSDAANIKTWQFAFNRLNDLPEILVKGHEREFLGWLFQNKSLKHRTLDATAMDFYVSAYQSPGAARAGFSYYREMLSDTARKQAAEAEQRGLPMPVLSIGGEGGIGNALEATLKPLTTELRSVVLAGCGHFLPDECPREFSRAVLDFWSEVK